MTTQEWRTTGASQRPDHALALELVQVTEAAAIAAARWVGRGQPNSGKAAATAAMHDHLMSVPMRGVVVIGEDKKNDTSVLRTGDEAGLGDTPLYDLGIRVGGGALPPLKDVSNSLVAIVVAERGSLYAPPPSAVAEMLAVGPDCADVVDIARPVAENLRAVAAAKGMRMSDVEVAVLNRSRQSLVNEIRGAGARVRVPQGGEIAGAIAAAPSESSVDLLLGTGGAAEAIIAAAALSCLGGSLQVRLWSEGFDEVLRTDDLVRSNRLLFSGTAVTTSELLRGVRYHAGHTTTQSMVLCSTPETAWTVTSEHRLP
ncbi:fructose-bisphosphatase class II [Pseudonocardia sp. N23]|uniref:fructose-bisphosphatase class II n=1 Tax=Pseudonocardia sp. N23 TaxID=1987376 RepID=UPI000BFB38E8|nr:fructose-bisphosphatase class II [Pseudonocardia sp. N23]